MKVSSSHWAQPTWQKRPQDVRLKGGPTTGHSTQAGVCLTLGPAHILLLFLKMLTDTDAGTIIVSQRHTTNKGAQLMMKLTAYQACNCCCSMLVNDLLVIPNASTKERS